MLDDPELIDSLFDNFISGLVNTPDISKYVTTEQKKNVLQALDVKIVELNETTIEVSFLFMKLTVDATEADNPKINMSFDLSKFNQLSTKS